MYTFWTHVVILDQQNITETFLGAGGRTNFVIRDIVSDLIEPSFSRKVVMNTLSYVTKGLYTRIRRRGRGRGRRVSRKETSGPSVQYPS